MRRLILTGGVAAALFMCASSRADRLELDRNKPVPENQKIPTADFFRAPLLFNPRVNSDGTDIAAQVMTTVNNTGLLHYNIASKKIETIGLPSNQDVGYYGWLGSSRLFYFVSVDKHWGVGVYGVNLSNFGETYPIFQYEGAAIIGIPKSNPAFPLVWLRSDTANNNQDEGVVIANTNVRTGRSISLTAETMDWSSMKDADEANQRHIKSHYPVAPGIGASYLTALSGELKYALTSENGFYSLYRLENDRWIKTPFDLDKVDFLTSGNEPDQILIRGPRQEGKPRAVQWANAKTGELGAVLFQDDAYDFSGSLYRDDATEEIVGLSNNRNGPFSKWFTDEYRGLQKILDGSFPGQVVKIINSDDKKNVFVVVVYTDRQPGIYYVVNLREKKVGLIKSAEPWVDAKRMQPMNVIKYKTRDGHKLDAYLTLPKGATKQHLPPLIVLAHGGPWARDTWGYDGEAQFLAARGYAVLQPNYRGSTSYDWMFPEADLWDFRKMHDDVTDAAKLVIASGYIDPARVAIMGSSFGGYLALSGAVNEPGLYKCAVTIAGVFDWSRLINEKKYDQYTNSEYAVLKRKLGDPTKLKEKFDAISPLRHVDKVRIPMFVAAGTEDERVDVAESRSLIGELSKYNIPHEQMIAFGEGHGMHHVENQVILYDRIDAFLAKYLSPEPVLAEPAPPLDKAH